MNQLRTSNHMGFTTQFPDRYSQKFVTFVAERAAVGVDIGSAFGVATLPAVEKGGTVYSVDLSLEHLEHQRNQLSAEGLQRWHGCRWSFPHQTNFEDSTIDAVLLARVLHFLSGPEINDGLAKAYNWLKPGGKIYIVASTPFQRNLLSFQMVYESRKKNDDPWPGFVENARSIADEYRRYVPTRMHYLDKDILKAAVVRAGFQIEDCQYFERPEFPDHVKLDGRESVGLIATKPLHLM